MFNLTEFFQSMNIPTIFLTRHCSSILTHRKVEPKQIEVAGQQNKSTTEGEHKDRRGPSSQTGVPHAVPR